MLSPEERNKSLERAINSWKVRTELANKIGKGKVLAEYEKIKRLTMALDDKYILIYITTGIEAVIILRLSWVLPI